MLFNPNTTCVIIKNSGYNDYGEPQYGERVVEKCAVLNAGISTKKSSVRADSSASRGNAWENIADYWFIFMPDTVADIDDLVEFNGHQLKIIKLIPRYSLTAEHDHTEAHCQMWNEVIE